MTLCLITDDVALGREAEAAGIERVMIDLEREGKAERQAGRQLFLSSHRLASILPMKRALRSAAVVVRTNPLGPRSAAEVDAVIDAGADFVMLPYFFGLADVQAFVTLVGGRCRVVLLVETREAVEALRLLAREPGVDEIHIGLNDLSISLGHPSIFESVRSGLMDRLAGTLCDAGVPFGFGGIARLSRRDLPIAPERMLGEQVRLGASRGWLGRTFRDGLESREHPGQLAAEVRAIRAAVTRWQEATPDALLDNRERFCREVEASPGAVDQARTTQLPDEIRDRGGDHASASSRSSKL